MAAKKQGAKGASKGEKREPWSGKGKFTEGRVRAVLEALEQGATKAQAASQAGIGESTLHRWAAERGEFKEAMLDAEGHFRRTCPAELRRLALERLLGYLTDGATEIWEKKREEFDGSGKITSTIKESHKVKRGTPNWVIHKILPNAQPKSSMGIIEAVAALAREGILPPNFAENVLGRVESLEADLSDLFSAQLEPAEVSEVEVGDTEHDSALE